AHEIDIDPHQKARDPAPIDQHQSDEDTEDGAEHDRQRRDQDSDAEALRDGPARGPGFGEELRKLVHRLLSAEWRGAARKSAARRRSDSRRRHTSGWRPARSPP